jgi:uncharacterized protein
VEPPDCRRDIRLPASSMTLKTPQLELSVLQERLAVSRFAPGAPIPPWATEGSFFSLTGTGDELSILAPESLTPLGAQSQRGWRALKLHGPLAFSEIGVLSALLVPLAEAKIAVFVLSTFDTDYVLVASSDLEAACRALERAGHTIHRSNSE